MKQSWNALWVFVYKTCCIQRNARKARGEILQHFPSYSSMARRGRKDLHCSPLANSPSLAYSMRGERGGTVTRELKKPMAGKEGEQWLTYVLSEERQFDSLSSPLLPPIESAPPCVYVCVHMFGGGGESTAGTHTGLRWSDGATGYLYPLTIFEGSF